MGAFDFHNNMLTDEIKKYIVKVAVIVGVALFLLYTLASIIAFTIFNIITNPGDVIIPQGKSNGVNIIQTSPSQTQILPEEPTPNREIHTFRGRIVSDPEYAKTNELGSEWYWLYSDEPFNLGPNVYGLANNLERLQIVDIPRGLKVGTESITDYVGMHVEVKGSLGWGYAESSVIEPFSITIIE